MRKFRLAMVGLIFCAILSACQLLRPQPPATPTILPTVSPVLAEAAQCALRSDAMWRTWRADSQPGVVYTLLTEPGSVWAGTNLGAFRIDPRTGVATQSLDYATSNGIRKLFPLGEGRVWADTGRGPFYFDGKEWTPLQITGTVSPLNILAIDLNGDVLLEVSVSRSYIRYRLPGHVPPPRYRPWEATREPVSNWGVPTDCQFQAYISSGFSYHSQAECQSLNQARQTIQEKTGRDAYVALDADGSIWWAISSFLYSASEQPLLGHLSKSVSVTLQVPSRYINWIMPDPAHGVWIGTESGLLYSDGQDVRSVSLRFGACTIPGNPSGLVVDARGTAWVVTWDGIRALSPNETEWRHIPDPIQPSLRPAQANRSIAPASSGGIWATHTYDLFRIGSTVSVPPVKLPDQCFVFDLAADASNVWGWGGNCGILQFNLSSASWVRHDSAKSDLGQVVIGSDGTVYTLEWDGLYAYAGSEWQRVLEINASVIVPGRQSGVWIASRARDKLWYYKAGQVTPYGLQFDEHVMQSMAVDNQNRLWAVSGDVLSVFDGKNWRSVSTPMRQIRELVGGPDGRIWLVGDLGVAVYDPAKDKQP
jgi:ligand-binding sensor domain-containing protein